MTRDGVTKLLYCPNSKQQIAYHEAREPNVILEGSRGGGKSYCMRWDAYIRCLTSPGFKALILRRTMPELRQSHLTDVDHETQQLEGHKVYNKSEFTVQWTNGSLLMFGHCEDDAAIARYLSSQWDLLVFDETVTFTLRMFLLISASARTATKSKRISLVRGGTNPVGCGAAWVKEFFIDKNPDPEQIPDYIPADWRAIKVNLDDNPDVDQESYDRRLRSLPSDALRRAYRYGEWVTEGQFFSEWREKLDGKEWHTIENLPTYNGKSFLKVPWIEIVRSIDWGFSEREPGICKWYACMPDNTVVAFKEYVFFGTTPADVAIEIRKRSGGMKIRYTVGDPSMWGAKTGESIAETFAKNGVTMIEADNDRPNGWVRMHSWLIETHDDSSGPVPRLRFLRGGRTDGLGCPHTIRAIPSATCKETNLHDLVGPYEDPLDETRYFVMSRPSKSRAQPVTNTFSPELRKAIYGSSSRRILGSDSVRHR